MTKDSIRLVLKESKKLNFKIFNNLEPELEDLWKKFEEKSYHTFFQNLFFIKKITTLKKSNFYFVVIYDSDEIIAIFPFEIKRIFAVKILQWLGTKYSDYCCPLISKEHKINSELFKDLWARILKKIDCDIIILNNQPKYIDNLENPFVNFLTNSEISKVFLIDLPDNKNEYYKNIENKKFLNEFKRTTNKIIEKHDLKFENIDIKNSSFQPSDLIKKKISVLNKNFFRESIEKNFIDFFDNLILHFPGQIKLSVLKIDKEIVAANLGFLKSRKFYYYMPTLFTNNYNRYSPGKILINELIKWSIENKIKVFDFGLGEEKYKKYWSNRTEALFRYFYTRNLKGIITLRIIKIYLFIRNSLNIKL